MDDFDNIINKLENMNTRFPHLSTLWKIYLIKKKQQLDEQIKVCDNIFSMMQQDDVDINIQTILLLQTICNPEYT